VIKKGFTLMELLVVMGVLAVLAGGVVVIIDPADKINAANDAKVQNDIGQLASASQSYAASQNGFYPASTAQIVANGDLVRSPSAPTGYSAYTFTAAPGGCTGGSTCTSVVVTGQLKAKKYLGYATWRYDSTTGVSCPWSGSACKP